MTLHDAIRLALAEVEGDRSVFTAKYPHIPPTPEYAVGIGNLAAVFALIADGSKRGEEGWEELDFHLKVGGTVRLLENIASVLRIEAALKGDSRG